VEKTLRAETGKRDPKGSKWQSQASKKSSNHRNLNGPVPETDTGGEVENTEGRERTLSKELGKMAP
jgi:hypothetical protein